MVALLLTTTISCSQAMSLINRIQRIALLTDVQKAEVILEIRKVVPFCPIVVKQDEQRN